MERKQIHNDANDDDDDNEISHFPEKVWISSMTRSFCLLMTKIALRNRRKKEKKGNDAIHRALTASLRNKGGGTNSLFHDSRSPTVEANCR